MSKRVLKYKTISKSEEAPVVGSVVEEKDTIFVKQITATEFEVFVSDETGYVVKLDKTIDKASFDAMVYEYVKTHIVDLKNALDLTPVLRLSLANTGLNFIFNHNNNKVILKGSDFYSIRDHSIGTPMYCCNKEDIIEFKGEYYPEQYIIVNYKEILGKNLKDDFRIDLKDSDLYELRIVEVEMELIEKKPINIERFEGSTIRITTLLPEHTFEYRKLTEGENKVLVVDGNVAFRVGINGDAGIITVKADEETLATWEIGEYRTGDFIVPYSKLEGKNIVIEAMVSE